MPVINAVCLPVNPRHTSYIIMALEIQISTTRMLKRAGNVGLHPVYWGLHLVFFAVIAFLNNVLILLKAASCFDNVIL